MEEQLPPIRKAGTHSWLRLRTCFSRQPEALQEHPQAVVEVQLAEGRAADSCDIGGQRRDVEVVWASQELPDLLSCGLAL